MTTSRFWLWTLGTLLALPAMTRSEEPLKDQRPVYFEVTLVEVPVDALKKAGIDVEELTKLPPAKDGSPKRPDLPIPGRAGKTHVDSEPLPTVVQTLMQEQVGRVLARSRIGTISGQKASLQIEDAIDLQGTPEALDDQTIKLEYFLKFSEPMPQREVEKQNGITAGKRTCFSSMGINLPAGKTTAVTGPAVQRTDAGGKTEVVALVTLLHADFTPPKEIRSAERLPPRPVLDGRLRELPQR